MPDNLKQQIVSIGKKLYALRLVSGHAGNLSTRLDRDNILITATGACLGDLKYSDIIKVNLRQKTRLGDKHPSSELPLHKLIYQKFPVKVAIHCHPPLTNAYFTVYSSLKILTSEAKYYLKHLPVVRQGSFIMNEPNLIIEALEKNHLIAVKNHGVVSIGNSFEAALYSIETLEESVKVAAAVRLFKKKIFDGLDKAFKNTLRPKR